MPARHRPSFLDTPEAYTRTARHLADPTRDAASLELPRPRQHPAEVAILIVAILVALAFAIDMVFPFLPGAQP